MAIIDEESGETIGMSTEEFCLDTQASIGSLILILIEAGIVTPEKLKSKKMSVMAMIEQDHERMRRKIAEQKMTPLHHG